MPYQVLCLGPAAKKRHGQFAAELRSCVVDLGLGFRRDMQLLRSREEEKIDWKGMPVVLWFGDKHKSAAADDRLLAKAIEEDLIVFPVVDTLTTYRSNVPSLLHPINGIEWDAARLVAEVLKVFGLTRSQRKAFISYKRSESKAVAVQLCDALTHRGYRVFLDTFSVQPAERFQEVLWGEMADVDLLVFLNTETAMTSQWVYQELARANDLGLGVLQLLWPDLRRTPGTDFSDLVQLTARDFIATNRSLQDSTLRRVVTAAERSRIRSLKSRRDRVVSDLIDQSRAKHLRAVLQPAGPIELFRASRRVGTAFPVVGVPDAQTIQHHESLLTPNARQTCRIVYDGLGVRPRWVDHLQWLTCSHRLIASPITNVDTWLEGL